MNERTNQQQAVALLKELGLKEYESKSFVALARLPSATAKEISEVSEVPRTRVYDATQVLEEKGLVEIQHSNPQRFRAVPVEEAVETLQAEYESRAVRLREVLRKIEPAPVEEESAITHEVWALSGGTAIANRTGQVIAGADREVVFVIGHEAVLTEALIDDLREARERGVTVVVGTVSGTVYEAIQEELPGVTVFESGLNWLHSREAEADETAISRLLLVDRETILLSSFHGSPAEGDEQAVFGRGFDNGIVAITRRLMATGLIPTDDPTVGR